MTGINSLSRRRDASNGVRRRGSVEVRDTSARFLASGVSDGSPAEIASVHPLRKDQKCRAGLKVLRLSYAVTRDRRSKSQRPLPSHLTDGPKYVEWTGVKKTPWVSRLTELRLHMPTSLQTRRWKDRLSLDPPSLLASHPSSSSSSALPAFHHVAARTFPRRSARIKASLLSVFQLRLSSNLGLHNATTHGQLRATCCQKKPLAAMPATAIPRTFKTPRACSSRNVRSTHVSSSQVGSMLPPVLFSLLFVNTGI